MTEDNQVGITLDTITALIRRARALGYAAGVRDAREQLLKSPHPYEALRTLLAEAESAIARSEEPQTEAEA